MGDGKSWVDLLDPTADEIEAAAGVKPGRARAAAACRHRRAAAEVLRSRRSRGRRVRRAGRGQGRGPRLLPGGRPRPQPRPGAHRAADAQGRGAVRSHRAEGDLRGPGRSARQGRLPPGRHRRRTLPRPDRRSERRDRRGRGRARPGPRVGDVHQRISALRHDILHIRQTLSPTRDAIHRVVDGRVQGEARQPAGRARGHVVQRRLRQAPPRERRARALTRPHRRRPRLLPVEGGAEPERGRAAADRDRLHPPLPHLRGRRLRAELRFTCRSCTGTTATRSPGP